jgi:uncharacterized Zn finger protein (UPF0148 family)
MPYAACPACKADVKYKKGLAPGSTVTCPECDEEFTPPKLKQTKKAYNPEEDEDTYKVGRAESDADERDKARKAGAAMRGAQRREREFREMVNERRGNFWFRGPEVWLLVLGLGAGLGAPFGIWLARNWDKLGDQKVFWIIVGLVLLMAVCAGLTGSAWAWIRRNRD